MNIGEEISCPVRLYSFKGTNTEADNRIYPYMLNRAGYIWAFARQIFKRGSQENYKVNYGYSVFTRNRINPADGSLSQEVSITGIGVLCQNPLPNTAVPIVFKRITYNLESGHEDEEPTVDFVFADTIYFGVDEIKSYWIGNGVMRFAARGIDLPEDKSDFASLDDFFASFYSEGYEDKGGRLDLNEEALYYDEFDVETNRDITFDALIDDEYLRPVDNRVQEDEPEILTRIQSI